jgi:hypothetical protein
MLWLQAHTTRIQHLIDEGTAESLTFAALLSRLALEAACYERLRNAHDYISPKDLKRWQPSYVINQLIQEVDPHIASSFIVSISKHPVDPERSPTLEDYEAEEFVEIGHQVGFDPKKIGKIWNSLGNFLHASVPQGRADDIQLFGDANKLTEKLADALSVLRELETGTLISSGLGERVSFVCDCGTSNGRRAKLLKEGQIVSCLNPECSATWTVRIENGAFEFHARDLEISCWNCTAQAKFPEQKLLTLARGDLMHFDCIDCGASNFLKWKLMHLRRDVAAGSAPVGTMGT